MLPRNLEMDKLGKFGDQILKINSTKWAHKQVNKNPKHDDETLDLLELEDSIREVCDSRKILTKKNRIGTVKKELQKISGVSACELAKQVSVAENEDGSDNDDVASKDVLKVSKSKSKTSTSEEVRCVKVDSSKIRKPQLPYNPKVDTFGDRILEIDSTRLTYNEAFKNPSYVDEALNLENASDPAIPIEFTQFVLRKLAVDETDCCSFEKALDRRAKEYLLKLIGPKLSEKYEVHEANPGERPSIFRNKFARLFCQKVITNLQNVDYESEKLNKLARIFPFQICKNIPEYKIDILKEFDDHFYDRMQHFLEEHFDKNVPARETIALFLNNIRHFFETKASSVEQSDEYLRSFSRLNSKGIFHFQYLYREYRSVREEFINCKRRVPHLFRKDGDFRKIPEKNIAEMASLLRPSEFHARPKIYAEIFEKYLFFFVHSLQIEENQTPVFFIDDMLYQCLKSLRRFRILREDINIVDDIAMITLLQLVGYKKEWNNKGCYSINSKTLRNIKMYITTFVSENDAQFCEQYKTDLFCELSFRINGTICFDAGYANKRHNCLRGIKNFEHQLICSVLSPDDRPITDIVCYSACLGQENRYEIPQEIVESVRNFVRLSTKIDVSQVPREPVRNVFLDLLRNRLIIS